MRDKTRLIITGAVALAAVGIAAGGHGFHINIGDDDDAAPQIAAQPLASLKDFRGVALAGPDNVVITQASSFSVRAEGDPRAVKRLKLYVQNGVLHVGRQDRQGWFGGDDKGATVHVALPALGSLALIGSGNMRADRLAGAQVKAELTGPGDLTIAQLEADRADLSLTGSGDLQVVGRAKTAKLNATGSGNIRAERLNTDHASLDLIGTGDIYVHVSEGATISLMGTGDAHVVGTTACKVSAVGTGEAECKA